MRRKHLKWYLMAVVTLAIITIAINSRPPHEPSIEINGTRWDFTSRAELRVLVQTNPGYTGWTDSHLIDAYEAISDWEECIRSFISKYGFSYLGKIKFNIGANQYVETEDYDILIQWLEQPEGPTLAKTEILSNANGATVQARILVSLSKADGRPLSHPEVKALIAEEIGHTLGLGHSNMKGDLMFGVIDAVALTYCHSTLDVYALAQIYSYLQDGNFQPLPSTYRILLEPSIPYSLLVETRHSA